MSRRVREAFAAVPRERFLPADQRRLAGVDQALQIGYGVTNSQPTTVRNMLDLLDARPGDKVLDVGAGSGWTTALLAHLVGPTGRVIGVERIPQVLEMGRANLADRYPWASLEQAVEGVLGWPGAAPYDRILVSAGARRLPQPLVDQLAADGVLVIPVAGIMRRVVREEAGTRVEDHGHYAFVPLVE